MAGEKKRRRWLWIVLGIVAVIAVAGIAGGGEKSEADKPTATTAAGSKTAASTAATPTTVKHTEADEVAVTSCGPDETGWTKIAGTATNGSSKRSDYSVELVVEKDGTQVQSTWTMVENVEPGQTALWDTSTLEDWVDGATCRVVDVNRDASL